MKKIYLGILILIMAVGCFNDENEIDNNDFSREDVIVYFFSDDGCPFCNEQKPYLEEFAEKYEEVKIKEIKAWQSRENIDMFEEVAAAYGVEVEGVPTTFIGEKVWRGFNQNMVSEMEETIKQCIIDGCDDKAYDIVFRN